MVALTDHYLMVGQANRNQVLQVNHLLSWVNYQRGVENITRHFSEPMGDRFRRPIKR
jgi:hypothetical protein